MVLKVIQMIAYLEYPVFFKEHHLLKTFTKCLNEGSKNMVPTTEDFKGEKKEKSKDHTVWQKLSLRW